MTLAKKLGAEMILGKGDRNGRGGVVGNTKGVWNGGEVANHAKIG